MFRDPEIRRSQNSETNIMPNTERNLTNRERVFVDEYMVDLDPKRAALAAGYSETMARSKAYQWVSNSKAKPHVYEAVLKAQEERSERTLIAADRVLLEYSKIGYSDIRKVVQWCRNTNSELFNQDGDKVECPENIVEVLPSAEIDDDAAAAISEISVTKDGTIKIKMYNKLAALDALARHLGMFVDRKELTGPGGGPLQTISREPMTPDEWAKQFCASDED